VLSLGPTKDHLHTFQERLAERDRECALSIFVFLALRQLFVCIDMGVVCVCVCVCVYVCVCVSVCAYTYYCITLLHFRTVQKRGFLQNRNTYVCMCVRVYL